VAEELKEEGAGSELVSFLGAADRGSWLLIVAIILGGS